MIKSQTEVTINKSFRTLIQSQNYEKYVLAIINKSQKIFHDLKFEYVENQSHGEADFVDSNGQRYDAKLLFDKKQGVLIGDPKNEINDWIQVMIDEKTEFSRCIEQRDLSLVPDTRLYRIMKERLASVNIKEHAIFFIPFPIVDEFKGSVFLQFTTDFLQTVYQQLVEDGQVGKRQLFFIYPSGDLHEYVLRDENLRREYIKCEELEDFISFNTHVEREYNEERG